MTDSDNTGLLRPMRSAALNVLQAKMLEFWHRVKSGQQINHARRTTNQPRDKLNDPLVWTHDWCTGRYTSKFRQQGIQTNEAKKSSPY